MRMKTSMVDSIWAPTCLLHISNKFTFLSKKFHSIRCSAAAAVAALASCFSCCPSSLVVAALKRKYQE